jgi:uncharacterized protein
VNGHDEPDLEDWRRRRRERVAGPEGWLTVMGLAWLEDGDNSVGSGPESQVLLPSGPERAGTIEVDPDGDVAFTGTDGVRVPLRHDLEAEPTVVRFGPVSFFVIERDGGLAVRIRDSESRARAAFHGLEYFGPDPSWRLDARFEPNEDGGSIALPTVLGGEETYGLPGRIAFEVGGSTHHLDAYEEAGEEDLFVMFGDRTNGVETYGGGRYMYTPWPGPDMRMELDFNKAYNPPCVFSVHTTCALPPPQNRLPFRVDAGEKRYEAPAGPIIGRS